MLSSILILLTVHNVIAQVQFLQALWLSGSVVILSSTTASSDLFHNAQGTGSNTGRRKRKKKRKEMLPVLDNLFPYQSLDDAWELHPLLATVYSDHPQCRPSLSSSTSSSSSSCSRESEGKEATNEKPCQRHAHYTHNMDGKGDDTTEDRGGTNTIPTVCVSDSFGYNHVSDGDDDEHFDNRPPDEKENENDDNNYNQNSNESRYEERLSFITTLINTNDMNEILNHESLQHGKDFQMVKKIIRNDQEWMGMLPKPDVTSEEAAHAFFHGGFTLVVNQMQKRWSSTARIGRFLESETLCGYVSCNLYMTPEPDGWNRNENGGAGAGGSNYNTQQQQQQQQQKQQQQQQRSGFEAHWDWMDVIILQVSGTKLWSVASSPIVYLSTMDMKHKPTLDEMDLYLGDNKNTATKTVQKDELSSASLSSAQQARRYDEFLLRPGDVLYIPRGFIHNASTISYEAVGSYNNNNNNNNNESHGTMAGPSLHLTFGIEHHCRTTMEVLLHHAIQSFMESGIAVGVDDNDGNGGGGGDGGVAIKKEQCHGSKHDISWGTILHVALGEVARRDTCGWDTSHRMTKDNIAWNMDSDHRRGKNASDDEWLTMSCNLRKSVPIHPAWKEIAAVHLEQKREGEAEATSRDDGGEVDPIWNEYMQALAVFHKLANLRLTSDLLKHLETSKDKLELSFCFPQMTESDAVVCPNQVTNLLSQKTFRRYVDIFVKYSGENFDAILKRFESNVVANRLANWRRDDEALKSVGHTAMSGRYFAKMT